MRRSNRNEKPNQEKKPEAMESRCIRFRLDSPARILHCSVLDVLDDEVIHITRTSLSDLGENIDAIHLRVFEQASEDRGVLGLLILMTEHKPERVPIVMRSAGQATMRMIRDHQLSHMITVDDAGAE